MRWPWSKPNPPPRIPPYQVPVSKRETAKAPGIVVEESVEIDGEKIDTRSMTETGVHKVWRRITGQRD
jgi:hypothetical protein